MYQPPKIQVQFLIEPSDALQTPKSEYDIPLPKFIYLGDIMNTMLNGILTFIAIILFVVILIIGSVLGRIHR
jgi:hypothetical protein